MSTSAPKPIHLLALFPAVVNAQEIVVPVRVGAEVLHLHGSLQLMADLARKIAAVLPTGTALVAGREATANDIAAAHRVFMSDRTVKVAALAAELGMTTPALRAAFHKLRQAGEPRRLPAY